MYSYGHGIPQNHQVAMENYLKSSNQGNARAQNAIGIHSITSKITFF